MVGDGIYYIGLRNGHIAWNRVGGKQVISCVCHSSVKRVSGAGGRKQVVYMWRASNRDRQQWRLHLPPLIPTPHTHHGYSHQESTGNLLSSSSSYIPALRQTTTHFHYLVCISVHNISFYLVPICNHYYFHSTCYFKIYFLREYALLLNVFSRWLVASAANIPSPLQTPRL